MNKINKNPPDSGEIKLTIASGPVSLQSTPDKKNKLKKVIKEIIFEAEYYLSGDITINIQWYVHEQKRYESGSAADVDNIIKPLIDAISGCEGIIIDDNQIQQVNCRWIDYQENNEEILEILIQFVPDEHIRKKTIYFVEYQNSLCLPVWSEDPPQIQKEFIKTYGKSLQYRDEWNKKENSYYITKLIMPMQRVFHKSKLRGFIIKKLNEAIIDLDNI